MQSAGQAMRASELNTEGNGSKVKETDDDEVVVG